MAIVIDNTTSQQAITPLIEGEDATKIYANEGLSISGNTISHQLGTTCGVSNDGTSVIQSIGVDKYGHICSISSRELTSEDFISGIFSTSYINVTQHTDVSGVGIGKFDTFLCVGYNCIDGAVCATGESISAYFYCNYIGGYNLFENSKDICCSFFYGYSHLNCSCTRQSLFTGKTSLYNSCATASSVVGNIALNNTCITNTSIGDCVYSCMVEVTNSIVSTSCIYAYNPHSFTIDRSYINGAVICGCDNTVCNAIIISNKYSIYRPDICNSTIIGTNLNIRRACDNVIIGNCNMSCYKCSTIIIGDHNCIGSCSAIIGRYICGDEDFSFGIGYNMDLTPSCYRCSFALGYNAPTHRFMLHNGDYYYDGSLYSGGADYSEKFEGDVEYNRFITFQECSCKICMAKKCDNYVIGISSKKPMAVGDSELNGKPIGLLGKLFVEKAQNQDIKVGDFVTWDDEGKAIKADKGYRVIEVRKYVVRVLFNGTITN